MLILTSSGFSPTTRATVAWSPVWNCSPFQTSQLVADSLITQSIGSIAACARYGNSNAASTVFAAVAIALAASPSLRARAPGVAARRLYSARMSDEDDLSARASSHSIFSASRPRLAAQKLVATIATPLGTSTT